MTNHNKRPLNPADLRKKAEKLAREHASQTQKDSANLSPEEINKTLHELQVHQIELEMQNEELRSAQAQIEAGRERYLDLYDLAPVGYCILSEKGLILEANLTVATLLGTSRSQLIRQPISRFIFKDDQDIYYLHRKKLFETSEPQTCELRLIKPNNNLIWAQLTATAAQAEDGAPVCRLVISDITDRKQAEENLKKRESHFRTLVNTIPDLIWLKDADGVYLSCNKKFERFFGASEPDILGKTDYDFVDKELADSFRENDRKAMAVGGPSSNEEQITFADDGHKAFLETIKTPMFDTNGKLIGILGIGRDITQRKQAEEQRKKMQAQLVQAQKMESVGRLAGGVAHDFNNMLSVILGHADMILDEMDPDQPFHEELTEIRKAGERSANLTRQLLAFARKQTIAPEVINLNQTIESMLKMLRRLIGEDIDLSWRPGKKVWPVKMDPAQIDQILANLCVNARDAITGVGKLTIETANATFDSDYCEKNPGFVTGDFVLLALSDSGCGMNRKTLANLFEPFYTTKDVDKGTGLGLATVYGIVKQNKGFINVYSEPEQGTTFKVYLPRHLNKTEFKTKKSRIPTPARGNESILVVEDEPAILKMTTMILKREGYTVVAAGTPGEAIQLAKEHPGDIHLLLTDVIMPEMNGRDLAKNLLSLFPHLKLLFMSGYTANVIAYQGILDEGVNFIQKPFSKRDLTVKVREVLDRD